jgi:hypothetical protein
MSDERDIVEAVKMEMRGRQALYRALARYRCEMGPREFFRWVEREIGWTEAKVRPWMKRMGWR